MLNRDAIEEAQRRGREQYGDLNFTVIITPNGTPGEYDVLYRTFSNGEKCNDNGYFVDEGFKPSPLEVFEVEE